MNRTTTTDIDKVVRERLRSIGLYGVLARWDQFRGEPWLAGLIDCEEQERTQRSLERRQNNARIGRFRPLDDFDWNWPRSIDKAAVMELFDLDFAREPANVVIVGPNGVGKTMLAQNIAYQAVMKGFTARFITASEMLNDLSSQDSSSSLERRIRSYFRPWILVIDELGYLSYDDRHADLLFEVVSRRNGQKPIVITTNKPFKEWNEVFPNASSVVALVDRLIHKAEIIKIDGESYRLKESRERNESKDSARQTKAKKSVSTKTK